LSFFSNHPATTAIYTLSLHDALPISTRFTSLRSTCQRVWHRRSPIATSPSQRLQRLRPCVRLKAAAPTTTTLLKTTKKNKPNSRSEEHTSELQSRENLVCRLLLEKKK